MSDSVKSSDVVIIGCGISGLSAAYHLIMNGFSGSIIVLESRSRIGGRISSTVTKYEGHRIELGANWIHGIHGNPIYQLAKKYQLIDPVSNITQKYTREAARTVAEGQLIDINIVEEVFKKYNQFFKKCELYYQIKGTDELKPFNNSVGQHLNADINDWLNGRIDLDDEAKNLRRSIFDCIINREIISTGSHSMDEVSLKDIGSYIELPGGNITVQKGYIEVLNHMLAEINERIGVKTIISDKSDQIDGKQFSILLSHKVLKIKWKDLANTKVTKHNKRLSVVEVVCDNGLIFRCSHIVVTLPLGVLKKNGLELFEPKLPQYKWEAINALGFGSINKVFLEYSQPLNNFTDTNFNQTMVIWNKERAPNDKWYSKGYSIFKITNHCLLFWASGKQALELEQLDRDVVNEDLTQLLRQLFNTKQFPKADNVIVTHWASDPNSCGSYSYIPSNSSNHHIELLAEPIYDDQAPEKPILLFAGEATHPTFYSAVHGAFLSGRKVADLLLENHNLKT